MHDSKIAWYSSIGVRSFGVLLHCRGTMENYCVLHISLLEELEERIYNIFIIRPY